MAKKRETDEFTPPTEAEIMLIQPNNVTFGQYEITQWQENLLTLIGDKLQKKISGEEEFDRDLFGQPYGKVWCDGAGGLTNKTKVLQEPLGLGKRHFPFAGVLGW